MSSERPLTIAHVDAETGFSGGEKQVLLLMTGLADRGHDNVLLCPPRSSLERAGGELGIAVRAVAMRSDADVLAVRALGRELRSIAPDVVHLHTGRATWLGGLAARLAGAPAITTRRQEKRVSPGLRTRLIYGSLVRRAVAISPAVRRCLEAGGVDAAKLRTIPSAVDPARRVPDHAVGAERRRLRDELSLEPDEPVFLVLAALVRRKGIDVLLDALASLPGGRGLALLVAGDGAERASLEAQAERLGLARARFLGRRHDASELLAACDVLVLPSRKEGLGVAALEAMASRRPVVASNVGGLGEAVVDGETGLLVPADDAPALAAALDRLARDPAERARLGAAGPARIAQGFRADQMVAAYEALYREVLAEVPA